MTDWLGLLLAHWRAKVVLPRVRGRLLDIGCGTNDLVRQYNLAHGRQCGVGVDVYSWPGVDLVVEDTSSLPFPDESFDTITIVAALNHIPNRKDVLREVFRLLHREGSLLVTMIPPSISRVWHWLRHSSDADQVKRGMKAGEVFGLSQRDVRRLLHETGFSCIEQQRFMLGVNCITVASKQASTLSSQATSPKPTGLPEISARTNQERC